MVHLLCLLVTDPHRLPGNEEFVTVYFYDLFSGPTGTPLTSTTTDSGASWPNDSTHDWSTGVLKLDGSGGIFQSIANIGSTYNLTSATMPSSLNFQALFWINRMTSITSSQAGLILISAPIDGSMPDQYVIRYTEGTGWSLWHWDTHSWIELASSTSGPAIGSTWYMKVIVSTFSGSTTFGLYYSTSSSGPFSLLFVYTMGTTTDPAAVGPRITGGATAATPSTGLHLGALYVQDLTAPTMATLVGPPNNSGLIGVPVQFQVVLDGPAGVGGCTITPASSASGDTFQAVKGGPNITDITIPQGEITTTFQLTTG